MRLLIGSDHAGYALKEHLKTVMAAWGHQVDDAGCYGEEPVDYPDIAEKVVLGIKGGQADLGLLVCGTGQNLFISSRTSS